MKPPIIIAAVAAAVLSTLADAPAAQADVDSYLYYLHQQGVYGVPYGDASLVHVGNLVCADAVLGIPPRVTVANLLSYHNNGTGTIAATEDLVTAAYLYLC